MDPSYFYAYEKFTDALHSLATGAHDVRQRLRFAYNEFYPVQKRHLPDNLQNDYQWILTQLTKHGSVVGRNGKVLRGAVEETLNHIRNSTGSKIAERILYIYHELNWLYTEGSESPNKINPVDAKKLRG